MQAHSIAFQCGECRRLPSQKEKPLRSGLRMPSGEGGLHREGVDSRTIAREPSAECSLSPQKNVRDSLVANCTCPPVLAICTSRRYRSMGRRNMRMTVGCTFYKKVTANFPLNF